MCVCHGTGDSSVEPCVRICVIRATRTCTPASTTHAFHTLACCWGPRAVASRVRALVFDQLKYTCSAGVAHNKTLAKLVCDGAPAVLSVA